MACFDKLEIESARFNGIPREQRHFKVCSSNLIENEYNFCYGVQKIQLSDTIILVICIGPIFVNSINYCQVKNRK